MKIHGTRGYTLLEMVIVVAVLATIAALAIPTDSPNRSQTLRLAASELADALRFAREAAQRSGTVHGVSTDTSGNQIRVFRLDEGPNPNLAVFDVYHPITKQIYVVNFSASPYRDINIAAVGGQMTGACNDPENIAFDLSGVVRCTEPIATRIRNAAIQLDSGSMSLSVLVDEYTGRVAIQ